MIVTGTVALAETTRPYMGPALEQMNLIKTIMKCSGLVMTSHSVIVLPPDASTVLHLIFVQHSRPDFSGLFTCQEISCNRWLKTMAAHDG